MPDLPNFLYVLVDNPTLIVIPIILFAAVALWTHSRTALVATVAWDLYLIYELGMKAGEFCGGTACLKRTPLYVVYPLLAVLSLMAMLQGYVRIRDKRMRERSASTAPLTLQDIDPLVQESTGPQFLEGKQ